MRILACRNFRVSYSLAKFETFSAALTLDFPLALGFPRTLGQFLHSSSAQVRALVAAYHEVRVANVARPTAPLPAAVSVEHLIADCMGLQRVFSSVHVQSHAIRLSSEGRD
jgi:hypothetical protein